MNIQARTVTNRRPARRRQSSTSGASWGNTFGKILYLLLLAVTVCAIFNYRVDLSRRESELLRNINQVKREINELDLDILRLRNERERLSSREYITGQIARYNLKLRPPEPDQTRCLTVYYRNHDSQRTRSGSAALRGPDAEARLSLNRR